MLFKSKQKYEPDAVPTTVEEAIPLLGVCEDGICLVGRNLWSKTFRFTDVNYSVASGEDKENLFLAYSDILNSLDAGATSKITINSRRIQRSQFEKTNMIPSWEIGLIATATNTIRSWSATPICPAALCRTSI